MLQNQYNAKLPYLDQSCKGRTKIIELTKYITMKNKEITAGFVQTELNN